MNKESAVQYILQDIAIEMITVQQSRVQVQVGLWCVEVRLS